MALAPRRRATAAPRRGRLRGGRPCGATALRCAVRGRTAELAPRPAAVALRHAAVSQKVGRAGAPRPRPCAARHRVLCRPRRGAAAARNHDLGRANETAPIAKAVPAEAPSCSQCHGLCHGIRVPCTGSGPIRGRGEQRRRRGGALARLLFRLTAACLSEVSPSGDAKRVRPCAPAPSSATQSARRTDRDPGPEPVQGARISCATFFARALRARTTCPNVCEALTPRPRQRPGVTPPAPGPRQPPGSGRAIAADSRGGADGCSR